MKIRILPGAVVGYGHGAFKLWITDRMGGGDGTGRLWGHVSAHHHHHQPVPHGITAFHCPFSRRADRLRTDSAPSVRPLVVAIWVLSSSHLGGWYKASSTSSRPSRPSAHQSHRPRLREDGVVGTRRASRAKRAKAQCAPGHSSEQAGIKFALSSPIATAGMPAAPRPSVIFSSGWLCGAVSAAGQAKTGQEGLAALCTALHCTAGSAGAE